MILFIRLFYCKSSFVDWVFYKSLFDVVYMYLLFYEEIKKKIYFFLGELYISFYYVFRIGILIILEFVFVVC